jgi:hypothetical protein
MMRMLKAEAETADVGRITGWWWKSKRHSNRAGEQIYVYSRRHDGAK